MTQFFVFAIVLSLAVATLGRDACNDRQVLSYNTNDIEYYLFSNPENPTSYTMIEYLNSTSLTRSGFDPTKPTNILIHGLMGDKSNFEGIKNAYLQNGTTTRNIIIVDWGKLAKPDASGFFAFLYIGNVVENLGSVGQRVADFITWVGQESGGGLQPNTTHLVGHSFGAIISGEVGAAVLEHTGEQIGRISALDAAPFGMPGCRNSSSRPIKEDDATFIDAYHTSNVGEQEAFGTVDFILNGGKMQPGCLLDVSGGCSHVKVLEQFEQTIREGDPAQAQGVLRCACSSPKRRCCERKVNVGEYTDRGITGTQYVKFP